MIELDIEKGIPMENVVGGSEDEVQLMLENEIANALSDEMRKHIEEMAFIDMSVNAEKQTFDVTASLVLCSKQDLATAAEIQAQKLNKYGLTVEQIEDVLMTGLESTGGF